MQGELLLARNLQNALIQQDLPEFRNNSHEVPLQLEERYIPSFHLSGDFFYVFKTLNNCAAVLLADVIGHGVRAAMVTAMIQIAVQQLQAYADQPAEFMNHLNALLNKSMVSSDHVIFATAVYCHVDFESGIMTYIQAGAGHGVLLHDNPEKNPIGFDSESICPALGLFQQTEYTESSIQMARGDRVILYTDGIIEAANGGEIFGENRLKEFLWRNREESLPQLMDGLIDSVKSFSQTENFEDDVCLVGLNLLQIE